MSLRNIGIVYRKELLDSLRDRRTLISMIVVPILLIPALTIGLGYVSVTMVIKAKREIPKVMIVGGEDSPQVLAGLRQLKTIQIVPPSPSYVDLISDKKIRAAVEIPQRFEARLARGEPSTIHIDVYEGEIRSTLAAERLAEFFRGLRDTTVRERLSARRLSESLVKPFEITEKNVVAPEKVFGNAFGAFIPYVIILLCMTGAMYPAMDLTAGEKERGTIETILCSPVSRTHLVLGKFFMVLTASMATGLLAITSLAVTFRFVKNMMTEFDRAQTARIPLTIDPKAVLAVFAMVVPLAVIFSAALLAIALFAKSFREAQSYLSPLTMVVIVPAVSSLLPGIELNARLALVPILNTSLVSKEIITGTYHWNYIALIFASSCVYAAVAIVVAVKLFQREEVLFRG
jgi:sodium transport system permease protein